MLLVLLNSLMTLVVVWAGWEVIETRVAQYMAAFLIQSGLINGAFTRARRHPLLLVLRVDADPDVPHHWRLGRSEPRLRRDQVLPLHAAWFAADAGGADLPLQRVGYVLDRLVARRPVGDDVQILLFIAFFLSFSVKVPMWPVHTWLPDAHVEAPTGGSVILAAITLKIGAYGFVRFILPIVPDASHYLAGFVITLSLIAIIYIGFVALVQSDMKKLIAYSSISHMGFVTLGFFVFNALGMEGGLVQMISHGFVSAAMFFCVGVMYDRMHSRDIADYGGVVNTMPKFAAFMMLFAMANAGLPATSGFVGEFMVILASVKVNFWLGLHRCDDHDPRRRVHAMDVQARHLRRDSERAGREAHRFEPPRVLAARERGCAGAVDGRVAETLYRRHALVGDRPADSRFP